MEAIYASTVSLNKTPINRTVAEYNRPAMHFMKIDNMKYSPIFSTKGQRMKTSKDCIGWDGSLNPDVRKITSHVSRHIMIVVPIDKAKTEHIFEIPVRVRPFFVLWIIRRIPPLLSTDKVDNETTVTAIKMKILRPGYEK